jgi:hypothetical protein
MREVGKLNSIERREFHDLVRVFYECDAYNPDRPDRAAAPWTHRVRHIRHRPSRWPSLWSWYLRRIADKR